MLSIIDWIKNKKHLLVVSHVAPDGDAIGSVSGMAYLIESFNIEVTAFVEEVPEPHIPFAYPDITLEEGIDLSGIDGIVCVDCANVARLHCPFGDWSNRPDVPVLNIDHHYTNELYGEISVVDSKYAATCEIIAVACEHEFVAGMLPEPLSTALYLGIVTDTGCFKFSNVSKSVFNTCAYLMDNGARHEAVINSVYFGKPRGQVEFEAEMMKKASYFYDGRLVIACLSQEDFAKYGLKASQVEECTQRLREIGTVKVAIRLIETDDGVRVSLRSKDASIDVSKVAQKYDGGGHKMAAGAFVKHMPLKPSMIMLASAFKEFFA